MCEDLVRPVQCTFGPGTRMMLASGTVRAIEDVRAGDILLGEGSTGRRVAAAASARTTESLYRVVPKIGEAIVVSKDHMLALVRVGGPCRGQTVDMRLEDYMELHPKQRAMYNWYRTPVQFEKAQAGRVEKDRVRSDSESSEEADLAAMATAAPTDEDVLAYLHGFFMDGHFSADKQGFAKAVFRHTPVAGGSGEVDLALLHTLFGSELSAAASVPGWVKYGKSSVRAEFLAGVLDTASYNKVTKRFDLTVESEQLCIDLLFVASSLGYYCSHICNMRYSFARRQLMRIHVVYMYPNTNTCLPSRIFDIVPIKTQFPNLFSTDFVVEPASPCSGSLMHGLRLEEGSGHRVLLADFSVAVLQ